MPRGSAEARRSTLLQLVCRWSRKERSVGGKTKESGIRIHTRRRHWDGSKSGFKARNKKICFCNRKTLFIGQTNCTKVSWMKLLVQMTIQCCRENIFYILKWLWKELKDCIRNEEEIEVVKRQWRLCGFTLLTLPRFPYFLYYLEKMSQVLDSSKFYVCVCAYAEKFLHCVLEETKCKPDENWYSSSGIQEDLTTTENCAEKVPVAEPDY